MIPNLSLTKRCRNHPPPLELRTQPFALQARSSVWLERFLDTEEVDGSSPFGPTTLHTNLRVAFGANFRFRVYTAEPIASTLNSTALIVGIFFLSFTGTTGWSLPGHRHTFDTDQGAKLSHSEPDIWRNPLENLSR